MAKYTREQRQRAVELYVKYECCAADVIRELGYPSREALRMWHRDWLDEQGTGVSSQRGERYARYTEEQKCISSSRCFVFSHVFFSGWGWCRFVGLVVDSITTNHATRPSSRRRSMMLMPNSVLIRLSRYQTM